MSDEQALILVVDDDFLNRTLLAASLEEQGYAVELAEDGEQALEALARRAFDLVLLDIVMPNMDGYQVLSRMAEDRRLRNVPVIVTTAVDEFDSSIKCIEMGAEDYLPKPVNPVLLRARIGASLEKKRLRDQTRELLRKFATDQVADDLERSGFYLGGKLVFASVLFCDIRAFTTLAESQTPAETIALLNDYYEFAMAAIGNHGGVVNQMVGDGLMAVFGAPLPRPEHRACAVNAALEILERCHHYNLSRKPGKAPVRLGVGVASGEVLAGYTGTQRRATYTCVGDTVNCAARLETHTKVAGRAILIDETTRQGLGPEVKVEDLGITEFKGKVRPIHVYSVEGGPRL